MTHEKIIKRPDGTQYKIEVTFSSGYHDNFAYRVELWTRAKGKRNWYNINNKISDYDWRQATMAERAKMIDAEQLKHVSAEEILQAKTELWEKMKPV